MTEQTTVKVERRPWHGRGLTSLLIGLIFLTLALSGLILYLAPPCRVARESGWTVFLLSKDQWNALHVIMACSFVIGGIFHVYFNWRILVRYLILKRKFHLKRETTTALLLFLVLFFGAVFDLPPFGYLTELTEEQKAQSCGGELLPEPIPGHGMGVGRLSLRQLCSEAGLSLEAVTAFLQEEGFSVSPENTIRELAQQKQMAPVDFKDFLLGEQQRTTDE